MLYTLMLSTAIAATDAALRDEAVFIGLLMVGPFVASATIRPLLTAAVGLHALTLAVLVGIPDGIWGTKDHLLRLVVLLSAAVLAVWLSDVRTGRERDLAEVAKVAEVAQRAILPPLPSTLGSVDLVARYHSAEAEALIGGDLYDAVSTPVGVRAILGDVRGKGLDAVRLATVVLGAFRSLALSHRDLQSLAVELDDQISGQLEGEDFVTAVVVEFTARGELHVVNCGHHPPVLIRGGGAALLTPTAATTPLGLQPDVHVDTFRVHSGDRLLLYTDGLVEARDRQGRFFPLEDHLCRCVDGTPLDDAIDRLVKEVLRHTGGQVDDDLALMLAAFRCDEGIARPALSDRQGGGRAHAGDGPA